MPDINTTHASTEISDLIGNPPGWLLRSGIAMVAIVTLCVLLMSSFIQYPDKITGVGILTSDTPPIAFVSPTSGYIDSVLVEQGDTVVVGDELMYIHNTTDPRELSQLGQWLVQYKAISDVRKYVDLTFIKNLQLGSIQNDYGALQLAYDQLQQMLKNGLVFNQIENIGKEIIKIKQLNRSLLDEKTLYHEELMLTKKDYERNRSLAADGVISELDLEKSKTTLLQKERAFAGMNNTIIQNDIRIEQLRQEQLNLKQNRRTMIQKQQYEIDNIIARIQANIATWNEEYIVVSSVEGVIQYQSDVHVKRVMQKSDVLGYIIPLGNEQLSVMARIPLENAGKVEMGQKVIIKFDAFPHKEYGLIQTTIESISSVPDIDNEGNRRYDIACLVQKPIVTDYDEQIPFRPHMTARVEIITESKSLLARIFHQLIELINT